MMDEFILILMYLIFVINSGISSGNPNNISRKLK